MKQWNHEIIKSRERTLKDTVDVNQQLFFWGVQLISNSHHLLVYTEMITVSTNLF